MPAKKKESGGEGGGLYVTPKLDDVLIEMVSPYHETNMRMLERGQDSAELHGAIKSLLEAILRLKSVHLKACEEFRPDWEGLGAERALLEQIKVDMLT